MENNKIPVENTRDMLTLGELRKAIEGLPDSTPFYVLMDRFTVLRGDGDFFNPINYKLMKPPFDFKEMYAEGLQRPAGDNVRLAWSQAALSHVVVVDTKKEE